MGCCGDREKGISVSDEQKWDYITLSDFKATSCLAPFSYGFLWITVLISMAVYAADAFTAVNLLAFNKWSSQVKPKVDFDIAKWIFAICIIVSYVFLAWRWIWAVKVIRSGGVAESYLEPLAAIYQSLRITKSGQGWRRFLVFAELTRSRKGTDYIALFVYFQFKGALIIILAQGPRIVINALTLWAVVEAKLIPTGEHAAPKGSSPIMQFFINIKFMTEQGNKQETIVYFTMLFSLIIWVFAALSLLISVIFYVFFLWHYVPSSDGRLSRYCRRKINARLDRIVNKKIKKAIEKQDLKRKKEERKAMKNGESTDKFRAPTLPKLGGQDDDASSIYSMARSDTMTTMSTLPPTRTNTMTTTRTGPMKQPSLPTLSERPIPSRSNTQASGFSDYSVNAPLLGQAGSMGESAPPMPPLDRNAEFFNGPPAGRPMPGGLPGRPYSPMSQGRNSPRPQRSPLPPVNTGYPEGRMSPAPQLISPLPGNPGGPVPPRSNNGYPSRNGASPVGDPSFSPYANRGPNFGPSYEMSPVDMTPVDGASQLPPTLRTGTPQRNQGPNMYESRSGTAPPTNGRAGIPATLQSAIQRREASNPFPNRGAAGSAPPPQRSATAPIQQPMQYGRGPAPPMPRNQGFGVGQPRGGEEGW